MTYPEGIERLEREKELLEELVIQLEKELTSISQGNVQLLEESMPFKQRLIKSIAELREGTEVPCSGPVPEYTKRMRSLQQELMVLWKKATGLNDLSKKFVSQKLSEIEAQIDILFTGLKKDGYTKAGKKSAIPSHTIKAGA